MNRAPRETYRGTIATGQPREPQGGRLYIGSRALLPSHGAHGTVEILVTADEPSSRDTSVVSRRLPRFGNIVTMFFSFYFAVIDYLLKFE